jgi:Ca-activated chloride channel family protein
MKSFILLLGLIAATGAAMAYAGKARLAAPQPPAPQTGSSADSLLSLSGHLVQSQVLRGSPGRVGLELVLSAGLDHERHPIGERGSDLVVVLDRSGSMQGAKLEYARQSLQNLLAGLTERDRFALFSYSDTVQKHCELLTVTDFNRQMMQSALSGIYPGGATNLGDGLQAGIDLIAGAVRPGYPGRVILISDGLANRGVTNPEALAQMAALAAGKEFAVSTIGVGADFNEFLMTQIADQGSGSYYYLDNPAAFAEIFQREFLAVKASTFTGIAVSLDVPRGVRVADASGYPVTATGETAVFYPGSLRSGQTRRIFLTLQVPTGEEREFRIGRITARYRHNGEPRTASIESPFTIACIGDKDRVFSSIDRAGWERKVLSDDYNRLKQEVAASISAGSADSARERIDAYETEQRALNAVVNSPAVARNLENDLKDLKKQVDETFQGRPAEVIEKRKAGSKALQYEGYSNRRTP